MSAKKGKIQEQIDGRLLEERKVFLWGQVDDHSAKHVVDRLLYLDLLSNEEIQLVINSPGGYVTSGFSIYDTITSLKSPVSRRYGWCLSVSTGCARAATSLSRHLTGSAPRAAMPN